LPAALTPETIGGVTIRRLLSHESGLVSEPPGTDFMAGQPSYQGVAARNLERVSEIFTAVPPNTQLKYCNLGYQLLGEIVSRISETPYPQYVAEEILAPLGMASTAFEPLAPELASRCAVGYAGRAFSDELASAPSMPPLWAEGGLWSTVSDLASWLSFQLAAHPGVTADSAQAESPVLAAASRREMHKPRYLSDEEWSSAWGHLLVLGPQGRRHLSSALGRAARLRVERALRPRLAGRRDRAPTPFPFRVPSTRQT